MRTRSDEVAECQSEEHLRFAEQQEEGLLVNDTFR